MASLMTFKEALGSPTRGDVDCGLNVFFSNCGTVVAVIFSLRAVLGKYGHEALLNQVIYQKILAGMTVTVIFGNVYYAWMAIRVRRQTGRTDVTAFPFGINTPAAFVFIFNIMATAARNSEGSYCTKGDDGKDTCSEHIIWHSWRIGCIANIVGGIVSTLCGFVGPHLGKLAPRPAMKVALAGIGITYLGIGQLKVCFTAGYAGLLPLTLSILIFFGGLDTSPMPASVSILLVGAAAGWFSFQGWEGGGNWGAIEESFGELSFYVPTLLDATSFQDIREVLSDHLGIILPVAVTAAVGTLLNVYQAKDAGDQYPIRETMIVGGLTSVIAGMFGSPLGTCVYIGHPQFKSQNGGVWYTLVTGAMFAFVSMTGLFASVVAFCPPYAMAPVILFVGIAINQDMFATCPANHLPAVILGIFPALADWVKSFWPYDRQFPPELSALAMGALFISFIWASVTIYIIDRQFKQAIAWCMAAAFLSAAGFIHQPQVDLTFKSFLRGGDNGYETFDVSACSFFIGYSLVAIMLAIPLFLQMRGSERIAKPAAPEETPVSEVMASLPNSRQSMSETQLMRK